MTSNTESTNSRELQTDFSSDEMKFSLEEYDEILINQANHLHISNTGLPTWICVILVAIGIAGNVINVTVFTRESMRSPLNFLLASLEAINILGFFTYIPFLVYMTSGRVTYAGAVTEYINMFVINFAMSASNCLTVAISIFRVIAVSKPLASVKLCSKNRAVISLVTILIVSLLILITLFYGNRVYEFRVSVFNQSETEPRIFNEVRSCNHQETDLILTNSSEEELEIDNQRRNERRFIFNVSQSTSSKDGQPKLIFVTYWYLLMGDTKMASREITIQIMSAVFLMETTIPCLVTVISTLVLLLNLWRASGRRRYLRADMITEESRDSSRNERKVTIMLLVILVLYVLAITPHAIFNAVLLVSPDNDIWLSYVRNLATSRIGLLITNSITFFVYLSMSDKYRKAFKELTRDVRTRCDFRVLKRTRY